MACHGPHISIPFFLSLDTAPNSYFGRRFIPRRCHWSTVVFQLSRRPNQRDELLITPKLSRGFVRQREAIPFSFSQYPSPTSRYHHHLTELRRKKAQGQMSPTVTGQWHLATLTGTTIFVSAPPVLVDAAQPRRDRTCSRHDRRVMSGVRGHGRLMAGTFL